MVVVCLVFAGDVHERVHGADVRHVRAGRGADRAAHSGVVRDPGDVRDEDEARQVAGPGGSVRDDRGVPPHLLRVHQAERESGPLRALQAHAVPHQQKALPQALGAPARHPPRRLPARHPAARRRPPPVLQASMRPRLIHPPSHARPCTTFIDQHPCSSPCILIPSNSTSHSPSILSTSTRA
jgi:hypothetical protein